MAAKLGEYERRTDERKKLFVRLENEGTNERNYSFVGGTKEREKETINSDVHR